MPLETPYIETMRPRILLPLLTLVIAATWALADRLEDTLYVPLDHPAIQYAKQPSDPVNLLDRKLAAGQVHLDYAPNGGYLASALKQLGIAVDSQVLVFSKGSIQTARISPRTPRAIYFNDEVTVGYVQNGDVLELTALDPTRGIYLYSLDAEKSAQPRIGRRDDCLRCHQGPQTLGVPGLMISSVQPETGAREGHGGAFMTDHSTPIAERWGGWYVTGSTGSQSHYGNNTLLVDPLHPGPLSPDAPKNPDSLSAFFDTSKYLAPTSDLIALMTLEHQSRMTNLLIRIGWDARIALHDNNWDAQKMDFEIDELVTYMLFADEAPFPQPISGVSTFTKTFPARGPRDKQGRSLRDFDLKTRLFRYPLSYMIYSAAFDALPDRARNQIYQRLIAVLSGKDQSPKFAKLPLADRAAALAIVQETKPNFPRP
jgi:hypothetical protein